VTDSGGGSCDDNNDGDDDDDDDDYVTVNTEKRHGACVPITYSRT